MALFAKATWQQIDAMSCNGCRALPEGLLSKLMEHLSQGTERVDPVETYQDLSLGRLTNHWNNRKISVG